LIFIEGNNEGHMMTASATTATNHSNDVRHHCLWPLLLNLLLLTILEMTEAIMTQRDETELRIQC